MSYSNIPQEIIIDTSRLLKYPKNGFNTFGVYVWHAYITNPKIIELQITEDNIQTNNNIKFKILGIFELEMRPGKQLFPLNYNNIINNNNIKNNIKAIKLIIRETYGGNRTYINQIMFYEQTAEQVKDLICGNELNKIYKNQKKLIENYSNKQLSNNRKINKSTINKIKNKNISEIIQNTYQAINKTNNSNINESNLKKYNTINNNAKLSKNKEQKKMKNENNKYFTEKEEINDDNDVNSDIYDEEGKIIDIEGFNNNDNENDYYKEEENNEENQNINNDNYSNYKNLKIDENKKYYKKIKDKKNKVNRKDKRKLTEITPLPKPVKSAKSDIKDKKNLKNKNHQRQTLEIKLNENLTPNKYLKRVRSLTNGNINNNSNFNLNLSKNFGFVINSNKDIQQNYSNIDNNNENNLNDLDYLNENNNFRNRNTNYNNYVNVQNEKNDINGNIQNYEERMSDIPNNINSMYSQNEYPSNSFNNNNKSNNIINNNNFIEQQQEFSDIISNNNNYNNNMNKTQDNPNFYNRNTVNQIGNKKINYSYIENNQSNNISMYSEHNDNNNNDYEENKLQNRSISEIKKEKNITNNTINISQRYSMLTNYDNTKKAKNNRTKEIKQKLDYLEGNIIEIKKEINLISENLSLLSSQEFIINNFKDQIIQICEEIYNENILNYNNGKNNSFISNSEYHNKNKKKELNLENEINKKIDEKLGNIKNNLFDKYLQPKINEIGDSMQKNIEQIKYKVDAIGNSIYTEKDIFDKNNSNVQIEEDDDYEYKNSSKLRNEKFDEINRIGEKLYNKLVEKEKKLNLLKQEKTRFLNEGNGKGNIDVEINY